jgi:hypothetical protein
MMTSRSSRLVGTAAIALLGLAPLLRRTANHEGFGCHIEHGIPEALESEMTTFRQTRGARHLGRT